MFAFSSHTESQENESSIECLARLLDDQIFGDDMREYKCRMRDAAALIEGDVGIALEVSVLTVTPVPF